MLSNRCTCVLQAALSLFSLTLLLVLGGCADTPGTGTSAPSSAAAVQPPPPYVVRFGDTLSTIAATLGVDYRALAQVNDLEYPYTIYAGQVLSLAVGDLSTEEVRRIEDARRALMAENAEVAEQAGTQVPPGTGPQATSDDTDAATAQAKLPAISVSTNDAQGRWQWPASGPVVRDYSATEHKGIDIGGTPGTTIHAAADGVVQQIVESAPIYGRLLIIQHGSQYLGIYGHNQRILVDVGETVSRGQPVAEMGDSGTDRVQLHFELRRNARPINPWEVVP